MSAFTPVMVAELTEKGSFTYDEAAAFASAHNLSTRQVISKVKHLGLDYVPKAKPVASATVVIRKSDIVRAIAAELGVDYDAIAGLAKADKAALQVLATKVA